MTKNSAELYLPQELLQKANLRGKEYAWPIDLIPEVITAAQRANLLSIGGQLQFRFPDGSTCECYWVDVDTYKSVPSNILWKERVDLAAEFALRDFQTLKNTYDFLNEGREGFAKHIDAYLTSGGVLNEAMYFVWYVATEEEQRPRGH